MARNVSSTDPACGVCAAPTGDTTHLCRNHTAELRDQLVGVPEHIPGIVDLVGELDVTITRQSRTAMHTGGRRTPERPLPWNEAASGAAHALNATVNAWALEASRIAEDERDRLADVHHSDTAGVAEWLARNLHTLRAHPEAGQAFRDIVDAAREARRAIDRPVEPVPFGRCSELTDDGECPAILYGHLGRRHVRCHACGALHSTDERLTWMLETLRGMLATIPELVTIVSLAGKHATADSLRMLAQRGRFQVVGVDAQGRPTYRVADVLRALDERYKRRPKAA